MKRALKYLVVGLVVMAVAAWVGLWAWGKSRHAAAGPAALAALASDAAVTVEQGEFLVFRPSAGESHLGVIFYPGANCDVRGYAPILRSLAAAGYFVVAVPMPLEFAFLGPNRARDVQDAFPRVRRWAMIGHSLGGAMAANFTFHNPDRVAGIVFWDSYPPSNASLAQFPRPVWQIHRATPDGAAPPALAAERHLFPAASHWVPIPGGIHMYFGDFVGGGFVEDWEPTISRDEQIGRVTAATLEALQEIAAAGSDAGGKKRAPGAGEDDGQELRPDQPVTAGIVVFDADVRHFDDRVADIAVELHDRAWRELPGSDETDAVWRNIA